MFTIDETTPEHILALQAEYGEALAAFDRAKDRVHELSHKLRRAQHEHESNRVAAFKRVAMSKRERKSL